MKRVKLASERIQKIIQKEKPNFLIRADIKGFYSSIFHYKLIEEIKKVYKDTRLIDIFERIIKNPIETCKGYKNPDNGVALRGPLSQFFSALLLLFRLFGLTIFFEGGLPLLVPSLRHWQTGSLNIIT